MSESHAAGRTVLAELLLRTVLFSLVLGAAALATAGRAHAQQEAQQAASARLLFKQGIEQGDAGNWTQAADLFRRALSLRESVVIRFNLAQALHKVGRLVEASEHLRTVIGSEDSDRELELQAEQALSEIEPRLATLTVFVQGAPRGATVELDGTELLPVQLGVPMPADPGAHEVVLDVEQRQVDVETVVLEDGGAATVQLTYVASPQEAAESLQAESVVADEVPDEAPTPSSSQERRRKRWIIGGSAAGAAVLAIAVIAAVAAGGGSGEDIPGGPPFDEPITLGR